MDVESIGQEKLSAEDAARIAAMSTAELRAEWRSRPTAFEDADGRRSLNWYSAVRAELFDGERMRIPASIRGPVKAK